MSTPRLKLQPAPASARQALVAVAWSFFGVRRRADHERDLQRLKPAQVLAAGLLLALVFVLALVLLVGWIARSAVAPT